MVSKIAAKISRQDENTRWLGVFFMIPYRLRLNPFAQKPEPRKTSGNFRLSQTGNAVQIGRISGPLRHKSPPMPWYVRLQQKWKVNGFQLILILITFAVGGSLTGQVAKWAMDALKVEGVWYWGLLYLLIVTALWPMMVLLVSLPMGQFRFFLNYIKKLAGKIGLRKNI